MTICPCMFVVKQGGKQAVVFSVSFLFTSLTSFSAVPPAGGTQGPVSS